MPNTIEVVVNSENDGRVIRQVAAALRANDADAEMLRDFAQSFREGQNIEGIRFQPRAGQVLACNFGLGFKQPEMIKVRPVLVISPKQREWTRLCVVVPISSRAPHEEKPYHLRLPDGLIPGDKYEESWVKGDMVIAVGSHRLDRLKTGRRQYETPQVSDEVLREARRCVLHATGMHSLTIHW